MADLYTPNLRLQLQTVGANANTWGGILNDQIGLIEEALTKIITLANTGGTRILTESDGDSDEARSMLLDVVGNLSSNYIIEVPAVPKTYLLRNAAVLGGSETVTIKVNGQTGVEVPNGITALVYCDGTDCFATEVSHSATADLATLADDSTLAAGLVPARFLIADNYNNVLDDASLTTQRHLIPSSATATPDIDKGNYFIFTLDQNALLANPIWTDAPADSDLYVPFTIFIEQDIIVRTLSFGSDYHFSSGIVPAITTVPSGREVISCVWDRENDYIFTSFLSQFEPT